jgi:hypothetical protein
MPDAHCLVQVLALTIGGGGGAWLFLKYHLRRFVRKGCNTCDHACPPSDSRR